MWAAGGTGAETSSRLLDSACSKVPCHRGLREAQEQRLVSWFADTTLLSRHCRADGSLRASDDVRCLCSDGGASAPAGDALHHLVPRAQTHHASASGTDVSCATAPDIPANAGANGDDAEDTEGAAGEPDGDECREVVEVCASLIAGTPATSQLVAPAREQHADNACATPEIRGSRVIPGSPWGICGSPTFRSTSVGPRTKIVNRGSPRPVFSFACAGQPDQIVNL